MSISRRALAWSGFLADMRDRVRTGVVTGAMIVLAALCAPYAAGFGYGLALWPAYEIGCPMPTGDRGPPDSYRTFLLGHGCDGRAAFDGVAASLGADPRKMRAMKARVEAGETVSPDDARLVVATAEILGRFRDSAPACSPRHWDCRPEGLSSFWNGPIDRFFGRLGDSYQRFFGPAFYHGLGWAAAHIAFIAWQGPLQRGALNSAYAIVLAMASALAARALTERWRRRRGR